ncbi:hypothetical protein FEM48_Zijuj05G0168900 [Ziziphus jujuba var. spinosa]|uniref:Serine aminopeptidase S33 domain-containing protein n=1 Tax=Ziziphus jujuba var. spinosa TaxID=714518 RepID=A0A978VG02_ZIZJJ|nr:hypothetical protein FEM48_Zijuj05G0168900 [Ziziphus jujuba var. spinosa]
MTTEAVFKVNEATSSSQAALILTSGASGRLNALLSLRAWRSLMILINAFVLILLLPFRGRKRTVSSITSSSATAEKPTKDEKQESGGSHRKGGAVVRVPATILPWKSTASATVDPEVATRRSLSIRHVIRDDDENSSREYSFFVTSRGDTVFTQSWTPVSIKIRLGSSELLTIQESSMTSMRMRIDEELHNAFLIEHVGLVVLMHGLNEHSGRYNDFAKQLNANGYKVYAMDWTGKLKTNFDFYSIKYNLLTSRNVLALHSCSFFPCHMHMSFSEVNDTPFDGYPEDHRRGIDNLDAHWCEKVTCEAPLNNASLSFRVFDCLGNHTFILTLICYLGHGGTDGLHGYVHSLDYAVTDLVSFRALSTLVADAVIEWCKSFLKKVLMENPGLRCFCFGHSTGAAIVLKAMLDPKVETSVAGVVLTSPAVGVQPSHPIFVVLAPIVSFLLPKYQISAAYKKGLPVCRDPEALFTKYSDPLVYTGPLRVRTGYEILRISTFLQQNLRKLRVPFFVLHGTADNVTDPEGSQKLYAEAASTDKTIKLFDGFLHDLLFEPERDDIMQDIIEWMNQRL